jgi:dienelactone hydrolase
VRTRRALGPGLALAALVLVAGATASSSPFAYDRAAPLGFVDHGRANHNYPIAVHDVSYASPRGGRVPAFLVLPPGKGPFPAVIYAHGSGGDRYDLVVDATWLAARGVIGLTIDDPFARDRRLEKASEARQDAALVQEIVDLRRAVDLLRSRSDVDPRRIAFVGFSLGARYGAVLAGEEPRLKAFDLMSGRGAAFGGPLDELRELRKAHAQFLFQLGRHDEVVPRSQLLALAHAAPPTKEIRWYDAGHLLNRLAFHDQLRWLARRLGVGGPVVRGALAGP